MASNLTAFPSFIGALAQTIKFGVAFNRAKFKDVAAPTLVGQPANPIGSSAAQKEWSVSAVIPVGATDISFGYAQSKGDTLGKSTGFGVQALHFLSKRTSLYVGALSTKSHDRLTDQIQSVTIVGYTPGASNIGRVVTYGVGIRHSF